MVRLCNLAKLQNDPTCTRHYQLCTRTAQGHTANHYPPTRTLYLLAQEWNGQHGSSAKSRIGFFLLSNSYDLLECMQYLSLDAETSILLGCLLQLLAEQLLGVDPYWRLGAVRELEEGGQKILRELL